MKRYRNSLLLTRNPTVARDLAYPGNIHALDGGESGHWNCSLQRPEPDLRRCRSSNIRNEDNSVCQPELFRSYLIRKRICYQASFVSGLLAIEVSRLHSRRALIHRQDLFHFKRSSYFGMETSQPLTYNTCDRSCAIWDTLGVAWTFSALPTAALSQFVSAIMR